MKFTVGFEPRQLSVISEHGLAVQSVGVRALHGVNGVRTRGLGDMNSRIDRLGGGGPGQTHAAGRILSPSEMDLFGRTIGGFGL